MKTKKSSIMLIVLFTIMTAVAQTFMKIGAEKNIFNIYTFIGLTVYGFGTIIFIIALKNGELSTLYPLISLSFLWVILLSFFYFKEAFGLTKIAGICLILTGTTLIGARSKR